MQQTAESSQRAVSHLEGETCAAFGRTEGALGSMHEDLVSNAERLANLEVALAHERQRHTKVEEKLRKDQQATVDNLTNQLDEALARVDRLSADLAKKRSLQDVRQPQHSPRPMRFQPLRYASVRPPQFDQGAEIMADPARPQRTRRHSPHSDHSRRHRSESRSSRGSHHSQSSTGVTESWAC